jgi:GGDEF domain-containing protein
MKFELLNEHYQKSLWRTIRVALLIAVLINTLNGQRGDWLRLGCYLVVILLAQFIARHKPMFGVSLFFISSFAIFYWMRSDPTGVINQLELGVLGFSAVITPAIMGYGVFVGRGAALLGWLIGLAFLIPQAGETQWPFAAVQITLGAWIGAVLHDLFMRLEQSQRQLERSAMRDELTDLENRRSLRAAFERYRGLTSRQGVPLLVTAWDVNDLKQINDQKGHAAGDAHLLEFVKALKLEARKEDIFFRVGGDEFVGLHPALEHGEEFAARVRHRFPAVAVGWALAADDLDQTLRLADQMMYANKASMKATGLATNSVSV